jgi:transcriptional regulator with XRE-family HTH domain
MRQAREAARLSLAGMAVRAGFSRQYLGNVETGIRPATSQVVAAYERVLGDDLRRRLLLMATIAAAAGAPESDTAIGIANEIRRGRKDLLTSVQTTHARDRAIAALVARNAAPIASLVTWSRTGKAVLRVNATGILAKMGSASVDNEAITALQADGDVRALYLTAVLARVLRLPWNDAARMAESGLGADTAGQVQALSSEVNNPGDAGARWCCAVMLHRSRADAPAAVTQALLTALPTEPARENVRTIGAALAGIDPLTV